MHHINPRPILIVESSLSVSPSLSHLLQRARLHNPLIVLPNADAATDYLQQISVEAALQEKLLPILAIWDVTLPVGNALETATWLQTPAHRKLIIADLSDNELHKRSTVAFGENAALFEFDSSEALVRAFGKMREHLLQENPAKLSLRAA
jgi:hypothetical protein